MMKMLNNIQIKNLLKIHDNYNSPIYLFDREQFIRNYLSIETSFKKIYLNTKIAYSYKTNPTAFICRLTNSLGGLAEVVSPMEMYHAVHNIRNNPCDIIYNGICADDYGRINHIQNGGIVNVDSLCEFEHIASVLKGSGAKIGIRIMTNPNTRFGMSEHEIDSAVTTAVKNGIKINGVHCHDGSGRTSDVWCDKMSKIIYITEKIGRTFDIDYIDVGGHFFGEMDDRLKSQFDCHIPDFQEYANIVAKKLYDKYGKNGPLLILEPGTALVANTISVLANVTFIKRRSPKNIVITDICCHDLGVMNKDRPVDIVRCSTDREKDCIISGYTCIENDIIHRNYTHELNVGDVMLIRDCGAYSTAMKPCFIMPSIAMLRVNSNFEPEAMIKSNEPIEKAYSDYTEV